MKEVYICYDGDVVLYVGQGAVGRHRHCISGVSHVLELNRLYFSGVKLKVVVTDFVPTDKDALLLEKKYITKLKPTLNSRMNDVVENSCVKTNTKMSRHIKHLEHLLKIHYAKYRHRHVALKHIQDIKKFISYFKYTSLINGICVKGSCFRKNQEKMYELMRGVGSEVTTTAIHVWLDFDIQQDYIHMQLKDFDRYETISGVIYDNTQNLIK